MTNHKLFAKIFLANIHRYTENVFGFFLANSFHLCGLPKFSPAKIFPLNILLHLYLYFFGLT